MAEQIKRAEKAIRGLKTGWLQAGSRTGAKGILFFIHGFPDCAEGWRPQLEFFSAQGYLAVAPDLRGVGASTAVRELSRYSLDAVALDHLEILRELDPQGRLPVVVVGHDIGGPHAWHLARLLGDRLECLVAINGPEQGQMLRRMATLSQLRKSWYIPVFLVPGVAERIVGRDERRFIRGARRKGGLNSDEAMARDVAPLLKHYRAAAMDAARRALTGSPRRLLRPVLVIWGNRDPFLDVPTTAELDRLALHHSIRIVDGGHWLGLEQPQCINELINGFLKQGEEAA